MTAIPLVSSFRLTAISRLKYLYGSFKTGSFLKFTETGYIHGVEIYGAIDIQDLRFKNQSMKASIGFTD